MNHGILIICHNNVKVIQSAMRILDDERFHFFIMKDKKSSIDVNELTTCISKSSYTIVDGIPIYWAGYSYTEAVVKLLKAALSDEKIDYFHMLQGADIPLKTPDEIDTFFEKNNGKNYVKFSENNFPGMAYRMACKHFFVDNSKYRVSKIVHNLDSLIARIQYPFHKNKLYYYHSALFSFNKDFVKYLVDHPDIVSKKYKYSVCADESLFGTIIMNSPYKDSLEAKIDTRFIDWKRRNGASPHTFTMEDYDILLNYMNKENYIFARKFSESEDMNIVNQLQDILLNKKNKSNK